MKKSKIDIIFGIVASIMIVIILTFIIGLIYMVVSLYNYNKCSQLEFEPAYCEKYKDY